MSLSEHQLQQQLLALRHHFDHAFTVPVAGQAAPQVKVLSIGIRGRPFSLALQELRGVHRCPKLTALPSRMPEMIGIAGIRGVLIPVYDLGALIGLPARSEHAWIALAANQGVGFAFDEYQSHSTLDAALFARATPDASGLLSIPESDAGGRPIVNISALVELIVQRVEPGTGIKERPE
jgi:chemotaxis signal transduction protein